MLLFRVSRVSVTFGAGTNGTRKSFPPKMTVDADPEESS